jgi:hypothetical protein
MLPIAILWNLFRLSPAQAPADPLAAVLKTMDTAAASFRTTQADFEWDQYQRVINEIDEYDTGTIYYRRQGKEIEMKAEVQQAGSDLKKLKPQPKYVLFSHGKLRIYQAKTGQTNEIDASKNKAELESYLVLGFGGSGQELVKAFDVTYLGPETINGVATAKLQLIPKSEKVRNYYARILLWIDLTKGISVQQQFFTPQQDYRLVKYSAIQVNGKKIPDEVFQLKTSK